MAGFDKFGVLAFLFAFANQKRRVVVSPPSPSPSTGAMDLGDLLGKKKPPVVAPPLVVPPIVLNPVPGPSAAPAPTPQEKSKVIAQGTGSSAPMTGTVPSGGMSSSSMGTGTGNMAQGGGLPSNPGGDLGSSVSHLAGAGSTPTSTVSPHGSSPHGGSSLPAADDDEAQGAETTQDSGSDLGSLASQFVSGPDVVQPYTGPIPPDVKRLGRASPAEINWGRATAQVLQPWQWAVNPALRVIVRVEPRTNGTHTAILYR